MSKEVDLKFLYYDIKEQIEHCLEDKLISLSDYNRFIKELNVLFPYINYSSLNGMTIKPELIENKLLIIRNKLRSLF